jgi:hypothetical protein
MSYCGRISGREGGTVSIRHLKSIKGLPPARKARLAMPSPRTQRRNHLVRCKRKPVAGDCPPCLRNVGERISGDFGYPHGHQQRLL